MPYEEFDDEFNCGFDKEKLMVTALRLMVLAMRLKPTQPYRDFTVINLSAGCEGSILVLPGTPEKPRMRWFRYDDRTQHATKVVNEDPELTGVVDAERLDTGLIELEIDVLIKDGSYVFMEHTAILDPDYRLLVWNNALPAPDLTNLLAGIKLPDLELEIVDERHLRIHRPT